MNIRWWDATDPSEIKFRMYQAISQIKSLRQPAYLLLPPAFRPNSDNGPIARMIRTPAEAHRLSILKKYMAKNRIGRKYALARHLGVSSSAFYGMIRQDQSRYSEDTLESVLMKIGCSREEWDSPGLR